MTGAASVACVEPRDHGALVDQAFTEQAASFILSAVANDAEILDSILELAQPQPAERWLEAACGPGIVSRALALNAASVHGVELTSAMVETARREAAAAGLGNVTFETADATATSLSDATFDGAVTRFSVHHVPVPVRLFHELARLVKPGGKVIVVDHLADDDADARSWSQEIERLRDPSHWSCLSAAQMRRLGDNADLAMQEERRFGYELDFDDWLNRGAGDADARRLVNQALEDAPAAHECFAVASRAGRRILTLQLWFGLWKRV
jgi:ubiquinone/menaquinone biosynthesis C-methylase UbiE